MMQNRADVLKKRFIRRFMLFIMVEGLALMRPLTSGRRDVKQYWEETIEFSLMPSMIEASRGLRFLIDRSAILSIALKKKMQRWTGSSRQLFTVPLVRWMGQTFRSAATINVR